MLYIIFVYSLVYYLLTNILVNYNKFIFIFTIIGLMLYPLSEFTLLVLIIIIIF